VYGNRPPARPFDEVTPGWCPLFFPPALCVNSASLFFFPPPPPALSAERVWDYTFDRQSVRGNLKVAADKLEFFPAPLRSRPFGQPRWPFLSPRVHAVLAPLFPRVPEVPRIENWSGVFLFPSLFLGDGKPPFLISHAGTPPSTTTSGSFFFFLGRDTDGNFSSPVLDSALPFPLPPNIRLSLLFCEEDEVFFFNGTKRCSPRAL